MSIESDFRKAAKEMFLEIYKNKKNKDSAGGAACGYERYSSTIEYNGITLEKWESIIVTGKQIGRAHV